MERTDYAKNPAKTGGGEFVSAYECAPETADAQFLLAKREFCLCHFSFVNILPSFYLSVLFKSYRRRRSGPAFFTLLRFKDLPHEAVVLLPRGERRKLADGVGDSAIVPAVLVPVLLVETLSERVAEPRVVPADCAHIRELVAEREHFEAGSAVACDFASVSSFLTFHVSAAGRFSRLFRSPLLQGL